MATAYYFIFPTIILGLGVSKILEGIGNYYKAQNRYKGKLTNPLILGIWIIVMLIVAFQYFAGMYQLHGMELKTIGLFLTNIAIPFILFIISRILIPDFNAPDVERELNNGGYDLREYFERNRKTVSKWAISLIILLALNNILIASNSNPDADLKDLLINYVSYRGLWHIIYILTLFYVGFKKKMGNEKRFWKIQLALSVVGLILICGLGYHEHSCKNLR